MPTTLKQFDTSWLFAIFPHKNVLSQIGWTSPAHSPLQGPTDVWLDIDLDSGWLDLVLVKPFLCWLGGMLWVVIMLKVKIPHLFLYQKPQVLGKNWYFELWISPSTLPTKAPVPAGETQSLSMKLMPSCFAVWMVFFWKCAVLFSTKHLLWLWLCR